MFVWCFVWVFLGFLRFSWCLFGVLFGVFVCVFVEFCVLGANVCELCFKKHSCFEGFQDFHV